MKAKNNFIIITFYPKNYSVSWLFLKTNMLKDMKHCYLPYGMIRVIPS